MNDPEKIPLINRPADIVSNLEMAYRAGPDEIRQQIVDRMGYILQTGGLGSQKEAAEIFMKRLRDGEITYED